MLYVNPEINTVFAGKDFAPGTAKRDEEVLREYEQLFIYQMLKEMRKTVPDYGLLEGPSQDNFDEMMDDHLAGEMARSGQFGIAAQLADQLALQKGARSGTSTLNLGSAGLPLHKAVDGVDLSTKEGIEIPLVSPKRGLARYVETSGLSL